MSNEFIHPERIKRGVDYVSFGKGATEANIGSLHAKWNTIRKEAGLKPCKFYADRRRSGCSMPICPKCGPRARRRVCMGAAVWASRNPGSDMSIVNYSIVTPYPDLAVDLFDQKVCRRMSGKKPLSKMVGYVITSSPVYGAWSLGDDGTKYRIWAHSRISVLIHSRSEKKYHRYGVTAYDLPDTDAFMRHQYIDQLQGNAYVHSQWKEGPHAHNGSIIVGGLLSNFRSIATMLGDDTQGVHLLLTSLAASKRKYVQVNVCPDTMSE